MKIYLHIGTEKTGTTSIQKLMQSNSTNLIEHGILYPKSLGLPNNIRLSNALQDYDKIDNSRIHANLIKKNNILAFRKNLLESLKTEINESNPYTLIISSEHLSSRINRDREIERLCQFLKHFSDDITVIVYLRRQDQFLESLYSTAIKKGNSFTFKFPVKGKERADFHYDKMLGKWENIFGKENIIVRIFEKDKLYGNDIIEDFLHILKIPLIYNKDKVKKENTSFGMKKLTFLRKFNKYVPAVYDKKTNLYRGDIEKTLESVEIKDEKIKISYQNKEKFMQRFSEENYKILKRYFPNNDTLFDAIETSDNDNSTQLEISTEDAIEIISKIWLIKEKEALKQKKIIKKLRSELLTLEKLTKKNFLAANQHRKKPNTNYLIETGLLFNNKKVLKHIKKLKNTNRNILIHTHIFKNAGTTFDGSLEDNFKHRFIDHREDDLIRNNPKFLKEYLIKNSLVKAFSSHSIYYKLADFDDVNLHYVYFLRHPIERMKSIYTFEKKQPEENSIGAQMAKKLSFNEYLLWRMQDGTPGTIRNGQTVFLSADGLGMVDMKQKFAMALENLNISPLVGVVDRYDESMVVFEEHLKQFFPKIDLSYIRKNVTDDDTRSLVKDKVKIILQQLDEPLQQLLKQKNKFDLKLYKQSNFLLDTEIDKIENFERKLKQFQERCKMKNSDTFSSQKTIHSWTRYPEV